MNPEEQISPSPPSFSSVGGVLCLDFINTLAHRLLPVGDETLFSYQDLLLWGRSFGAVAADQADKLVRKAARSPEEAENAFRRAIALREAAYAVFSGIVETGQADASKLKTVHDLFGQAVSGMRLEPAGTVYRWVIEDDPPLSSVSWMVARSVVDILTSGAAGQVRRCPGAGDCGFLFLDTSRNRTRRWCSMDSCGSRVKMRALYARRTGRPKPPF